MANADSLSPFTTDGCSHFPDGTLEQKKLWYTCCVKHDFEYWQGGSYQQRLESDKALSACVEKLGQPQIARLMLTGVRVGGTPFIATDFRWGYGWPFFYSPLGKEKPYYKRMRGYKVLSDTERIQIREQIETFPENIKSILQ